MNCFIWILLLLGCGGCGNSCSAWNDGCGNSCSAWNNGCSNGCNNNWSGCNQCGCNQCGCIQPRNNDRMNRCENTCNNRMDCSNPCDYGWNDNNNCDCDNRTARPWGERSGHMAPPPVPGRVREENCGCND